VAGLSHLLSDDLECQRLGTAGREFVCQHHDWDSCLQPLERLLGLTVSAASVKTAPAMG
jgi:hypothetical protein